MKRILKHLIGVETVLEEIAVLPYEAFEKTLVSLLGMTPDTKSTRALGSVRVRIAKARTGEDKSNLAQLQSRRLELADAVRLDEDVRVYKKLSEYIIERLTDIILTKGLEDEAVRIKLIDAADRSIKVMFSATREPEVTEVAGVDYRAVGSYLGVEQSALLEKVKVDRASYDGKGPGIIVPGGG